LGDGCEIDSLNAQADSVKMTDHFHRDQIIVNEQEKKVGVVRDARRDSVSRRHDSRIPA
jgi:hypothetical protein